MQKRVLLVVLIALVALFAALAFSFFKNQGPYYAGHSLSYWLQDPQPEGAETAIRAIGTNAVPHLLRWISDEVPTSTVKLAGVPPEHDQVIKIGDVSDLQKGLMGFAMLGTNAAPALPALVRLMKDKTRPSSAIAAIHALASLGGEALPYLTAALSDTTQFHRTEIVTAISNMPIYGVATNACLNPLLKATTDIDQGVRAAATNALRQIAPDALTNAPAPNPNP